VFERAMKSSLDDMSSRVTKDLEDAKRASLVDFESQSKQRGKKEQDDLDKAIKESIKQSTVGAKFEDDLEKAMAASRTTPQPSKYDADVAAVIELSRKEAADKAAKSATSSSDADFAAVLEASRLEYERKQNAASGSKSGSSSSDLDAAIKLSKQEFTRKQMIHDFKAMGFPEDICVMAYTAVSEHLTVDARREQMVNFCMLEMSKMAGDGILHHSSTKSSSSSTKSKLSIATSTAAPSKQSASISSTNNSSAANGTVSAPAAPNSVHTVNGSANHIQVPHPPR